MASPRSLLAEALAGLAAAALRLAARLGPAASTVDGSPPAVRLGGRAPLPTAVGWAGAVGGYDLRTDGPRADGPRADGPRTKRPWAEPARRGPVDVAPVNEASTGEVPVEPLARWGQSSPGVTVAWTGGDTARRVDGGPHPQGFASRPAARAAGSDVDEWATALVGPVRAPARVRPQGTAARHPAVDVTAGTAPSPPVDDVRPPRPVVAVASVPHTDPAAPDLRGPVRDPVPSGGHAAAPVAAVPWPPADPVAGARRAGLWREPQRDTHGGFERRFSMDGSSGDERGGHPELAGRWPALPQEEAPEPHRRRDEDPRHVRRLIDEQRGV